MGSENTLKESLEHLLAHTEKFLEKYQQPMTAQTPEFTTPDLVHLIKAYIFEFKKHIAEENFDFKFVSDCYQSLYNLIEDYNRQIRRKQFEERWQNLNI